MALMATSLYLSPSLSSLYIMNALSLEWSSSVQYAPGDRVAFKITGFLGVAAFECLQSRMSLSPHHIS